MERGDGQNQFIFVMNFNPQPASLSLGDAAYTRLTDGQVLKGSLSLPGYGVEILKK